MTVYAFVLGKTKVVDVNAPKRTKMDGMSRRKKRLYIARQEDKAENARQSIAAKHAKKATKPAKIGKLYDPATQSKSKGNGGGSKGDKGGKGKKRSGSSVFASEKSSHMKKTRT